MAEAPKSRTYRTLSPRQLRAWAEEETAVMRVRTYRAIVPAG